PERHPPVSDVAGEVETGADESCPEAVTARARIDEQDAELGGVVLACDAEDASGASSVEFGDPRGFMVGIVTAGEVGDDLRDERFEAGVPAVFAGVDLAMRLDDPSEIAGLVEAANGHSSMLGRSALVRLLLPVRHRSSSACRSTRELKHSFQWGYDSRVSSEDGNPSARKTELLEAAYEYVLRRGLGEMS